MSNCTTKQLVLVHKSGPAFSAHEIEQAHKALDEAGVPREYEGLELTLCERIHWMRGMLNPHNSYRNIGGQL